MSYFVYKYIDYNAAFIVDVKLMMIILKFNKRHRDSRRLNYFVVYAFSSLSGYVT